MLLLRRPLFAAGVALAVIAMIGCPPAPRDEAPTQAPVILPAATPAPVAVASTPAPVAAPTVVGAPEKSEDMVYNLGGFDPVLEDAPNDQKGKEPSTDLRSAHAVIDKTRMYVRLALRDKLPEDPAAEIRFWLEQAETPLVTVEVKLGTRGNPCELSTTAEPIVEKAVESCFFRGNPLDLSFPLTAIPDVLKVDEPFHVSGFQTCCMDEDRNDPFDEIVGAQEVFRVGWDAGSDAAP